MSRETASSMMACVEGPKADRSAMRMSRSSAAGEVQVRLRVVGRDEVVDERHGDAAGLEADLLLAVLEDDVVAARLARRAGLADAHVGAREALELQRDVLRDVAQPGAVREPA